MLAKTASILFTFAICLAGETVAQTGPRESTPQLGTIEVIPGPQYGSGPLPGWLVGTSYRDLWTQPIQVPVLEIRREAGGLTPIRRGGGRQTASLRLLGKDGREYSFRSIDKRPDRALEDDLRGRLVGGIILDQVSSLVPGVPVFAARIAEAAGVLHLNSRIVVMPDDPALGEYRQEFAGMLGTFEEFADEKEDGSPGYGGFVQIADTEDFLANLEEDPRHRVASREFLTARLLDLLMNDWDRHEDQWRWARVDEGELTLWRPIPRDRDYVMSDYDGALLGLIRSAVPNVVRFTPDYRDLEGLVVNSRDLDARLLAGLDRAVWEETAAELQARLTDSEIRNAIASLPAEFVSLRGEEFFQILRARRDRLPEVAARFYETLAEVHLVVGTSAAELAEIHRLEDGAVQVRLVAAVEGDSMISFRRTFLPSHTRELRIDLGDGADRAIVRGTSSGGIRVRVVGGEGADVLTDSSRVRRFGSWTSLHDAGPDDTLSGGRGTRIDRHEHESREPERNAILRIPARDHGSSTSVRPTLDYSSTRGVILGGKLTRTTRSFRRYPFASRLGLEVDYAPRWSAISAAATAELQPMNPDYYGELEVRGSGLDAFRFFGFGNETAKLASSREYLVRRELVTANGTLFRRVGDLMQIGAGVNIGGTAYDAPSGTPFAALDPDSKTRVGFAGLRTLVVREDTVSSPAHTRTEGSVEAAYYTLLDGPAGRFGTVRGSAQVHVPLTSAGRSVLGLRVGGAHSWGNYPVDQAAYLGGKRSLRGYPEWRFAGDSMLFGSLEAGQVLGRIPLLVNWEVRAKAFGDIGRVFVRGEDSNRWHAAPGVQLDFSALDLGFGVTYAHGPEPRLYFEAGMSR